MMTDKKEKPEAKIENDPKWSTSAKVGAAVGSAALMAALLYASKKRRAATAHDKVPPSDIRDDD